MNTLDREISRNHWIAADAAGRIANNVPLEQIETEALDALKDWIGYELQDRDCRGADEISLALPF